MGPGGSRLHGSRAQIAGASPLLKYEVEKRLRGGTAHSTVASYALTLAFRQRFLTYRAQGNWR